MLMKGVRFEMGSDGWAGLWWPVIRVKMCAWPKKYVIHSGKSKQTTFGMIRESGKQKLSLGIG